MFGKLEEASSKKQARESTREETNSHKQARALEEASAMEQAGRNMLEAVQRAVVVAVRIPDGCYCSSENLNWVCYFSS